MSGNMREAIDGANFISKGFNAQLAFISCLPQLYSLLERINPDHNFPVR